MKRTHLHLLKLFSSLLFFPHAKDLIVKLYITVFLTCCLVSYTFIFSTWLKVLPIPYFSTMCCKQTVAIVQMRGFMCTQFHFNLSKILPEFSNSLNLKLHSFRCLKTTNKQLLNLFGFTSFKLSFYLLLGLFLILVTKKTKLSGSTVFMQCLGIICILCIRLTCLKKQ